jgi:hypothetical protein
MIAKLAENALKALRGRFVIVPGGAILFGVKQKV